MKKSKGRPGIRVMCVNDGRVFSTISEAAQFYKIPQTSLSRQLIGDRKTVGGLHFVKVDADLSKEQLERIQKDEVKRIYNINV